MLNKLVLAQLPDDATTQRLSSQSNSSATSSASSESAAANNNNNNSSSSNSDKLSQGDGGCPADSGCGDSVTESSGCLTADEGRDCERT